MERLMKDEKEGQKGFAEEFTFELGLKKGEQVFSKLKAKGRKRVTLAKADVKQFSVFKELKVVQQRWRLQQIKKEKGAERIP